MAFYQLPPDMINTVFLFAIAGMGLQERLALKAALNFMVRLKYIMSVLINFGKKGRK